MRQAIALLALTLFLFGCGGGGGTTPNTPTTPLEPANNASVINSLALATALEGSSTVIPLSASDSDSDSLVYTLGRTAFLTDPDETPSATGSQKLILLDTNTGDASVVSEDHGVFANDGVINGHKSASGHSVALARAPNNLTQELPAAVSGSLLVKTDKVPIVGQVYHWRTHALLSETNLAIVDAGVDAGSAPVANIDTDAFGAYSLTNLGSGDGRLTATKTLVEADTNRVITSADALAALKIAVGLNPNTNQEQPVSPYQLIAADVNKDGRVTSADALATLKIAVGLADSVPQEWLFVPESAAYWNETDGVFTLSKSSVEWDSEGLLLDSPDTSEVNFVALLLGDVNGSWDAPDSAVLLDEAYFIALEEAGYGPLKQWGEFPEPELEPGDLSLEGKVIDGYISGAVVFLDLNFNGIRDEIEPSTTSGDDGDFNLELTASDLACAVYVPTVVDVPVGSIDKDSGEVTEAYQMVLPPTFGFIESADEFNITPLTSVFWSEIEPLLKEGIGENLTCENVKSNISSLTSFQESISVSTSNIVRHYNIPADKIFADYIAEGNAELSTKAELIVKGLKKSFAKTLELRAKYPQAGYAEVNYFVFSSLDGDELYPNAWYRETAYQDGDDTFVELKKISDDLETDIRLIYQSERSGSSSRTNSDLTFGLNKEIESRGGDTSDYSCNYQERITYAEDEKSYELVNLTNYKVSSNSIEDCAFENFAESSQTRYVFWSENYSEFDSQGSQFTFDYTIAKQQLSDWTDYQENIDNLNPEALVAYVDSLPKLFCQKGLSQANSVYRSKNFSDGDVSVTINRANDGSYSETRKLPDGTQEITNYLASENPTINSCTIIDSDNDGLEDYYDAAPLDRRISYVSAARDLDGDGVPDANDPDQDNDGVDNDNDAFPKDASEWLDNDGDNIGNNTDTDDDGDGVADSSDEYPLDPNNVLDDDGDGVVNLFDVFPNNENTTKAVKFNFSDVASVGITESISKITTSELVWLKQGKPDKSLLDFLIPKAFAQAGTISLANETNLKSIDSNGEAIDDAVLSSDTFFIAETVATPDSKYVYQITSPLIQESLSNLSEEICNLYVLTQEDDSFECALDMNVKEPRPIQLQGNSRVDFQLQGLQFRADNTAIFMGNGNDTSLYLLSPDFQVTQLPNGLPDERGPYISLNGSGWLDDEHVFLVVGYYNTITERYGPHIAAINITTNEVVDTGTEADVLENAGGLVSQLDDVIFVGQRAIRWNGSELVAAPDQEGGGIETIVDSYGRTWSYIDNYEGQTPKLLTSNDGQHRIELSQAARNGFDDQPSSGTGSGMVYRNFGFSEDYVLHKYGMNAKEPVQTVEGEAYQSSTVYPVANDQGYVIVDNRFSIWDYVPSSNTTGDVNITYTALVEDAEIERTLTIPASAVAAYLAEYPEPINPLDYTDDVRQVTDNDTIRLFTPEPHRLGFCLYKLSDKTQSCALLENYDSTSVRYDYLQNNKYLPQDYYECIDGNCSSGIQNLVVLDTQLYAYFRDDKDGQFYAATAGIDEFVSSGEDALTITEVTHTAGESEIMASANAIKIPNTTALAGVSTQYADKRIVINFANRLNLYATLPDLYVVNSNNEKLPLARDVVWNSLRNKATLYLASSVPTYSEVTVSTDDWLFLRNSAERYALPDTLKVTVLPSSSFVLDDGVEAIVTDFDPASGYGELFTDLSITSNTATIDMVSQPLDGANIASLLANVSSAKLPMASIPIRVIPIGRGSANVAIELYAGNDSVKDTGERYAELSFTLNWQADGRSALVSVPSQDVEGLFIPSSGQAVEVTIENFDEDVIGITTGGVNYPSSLDIRFMQILNKVNSILPTNILTNGEYTAVVTTDLAIVDQDGNALDELIVKFRIGD